MACVLKRNLLLRIRLHWVCGSITEEISMESEHFFSHQTHLKRIVGLLNALVCLSAY